MTEKSDSNSIIMDWHKACPHPVALEIFNRREGGVTLAHRAADGSLYGCCDIGNGPDFVSCLGAWIRHARECNVFVPEWTETIFTSV